MTLEIEKLKLQLERMAFVPQVADTELKIATVELLNEARSLAPEDYADLKRAIQTARRGSATRNAKGHFIKGESTYEVFINNRTPVRDPDKMAQGIKNVGEYAWEVHQYMGWAGNKQALMPSEKSTGLNPEAGGAFLERAAVALMPTINQRLMKVVFAYTNSLDK